MKIIFLFVFFVLLFGVIQFADNAEAIAYFPPPLKQISEGTEPDAVTCTEGLEIIFKQSNGMPACVKPSSVQKLVDRGYAIVVSHQEDMRIGLLFSTSGDFATHGYESYIAANMAIDDFNEHLKSIGKEIRLIPASIDTASESQNTLE